LQLQSRRDGALGFQLLSDHFRHIRDEDTYEDHLAINLRAAWAKASDYYSKLDDSLACYPATILHPYYKTYYGLAWADGPDWLETNNCAFQALWNQYKSAPAAVRPPQSSQTILSAYPVHVPSTYNSRKVGLFVINRYRRRDR
jgi:hypothetical protein